MIDSEKYCEGNQKETWQSMSSRYNWICYCVPLV